MAIASGTFGTCPWEISDAGVLTISAGTIPETHVDPPWYDYRTSINCAEIKSGVNVTNISYFFDGCSSLISVLFPSDFQNNALTTTSGMFKDCTSLASIDLQLFNTASVTNMMSMFEGCSNLMSLDVSSFDTSSVIYMDSMFDKCSSLTSLDVSGFDTSSVTTMDFMFDRCSSLTSLDMSGFDTSSVTNMKWMFDGCSSLLSLDVSGFDTSAVTSMENMFAECSKLLSLDVSNFDTSAVTTMHRMFGYCKSLTTIDLSNFDTSNVKDVGWMFQDCNALTEIIVGSTFDLSSLETDQSFKKMICIITPLEFHSATNVDKSITVTSDSDFCSLTTQQISGTWKRTPEEMVYNVSSERSNNGIVVEDGEDVFVYVTWAVSLQSPQGYIKIYKKLASEADYPSSPSSTVNISTTSGSHVFTFADIGDEACDFMVELYDGENTYIQFTSIYSNSKIIAITQDGNVYLALDTAAISGIDHDLYAAITALGWQSEVIE